MHGSSTKQKAVLSETATVGETQEEEPARGLLALCAIVLCERVAGVMVLSLLVFYLNEEKGLPAGAAARLAGTMAALSYAGCALGGWLADRVFGLRGALLGGLALLGAGYAALAYAEAERGFTAAATLLIAGYGLFKPSSAALVGALQARVASLRERAFSRFYYAINLGSALAPLLGAALRGTLGWPALHGTAAVCIGLAGAILCGSRRRLGTQPSIAPGFVAAPTRAPRKVRLCALALVLLVLAVYGVAFQQSQGTLLLWARDGTRRGVQGALLPPEVFAALPAAFVLLLAPLVALAQRAGRRRGYSLSASGKLAVGMALCAVAYGVLTLGAYNSDTSGPVSPLWLVACKAALSLGEVVAMPVALALIDALARSRARSLMLGLSFGAHALGYGIGAELSVLWSVWPPARFFGVLAAGLLLIAGLIQSRARLLREALA